MSDPSDPCWINRDRLVMSSNFDFASLRAVLDLAGYQCETGTLAETAAAAPHGHGLTTALRISMAEAMGATRLNRAGVRVIDHRTFALLGDEDLIGAEARESIALAGILGLGKLLVFRPEVPASNSAGSHFEAVFDQFLASGWQVLGPIGGAQTDALEVMTSLAAADITRPSLIRVDLAGLERPAPSASLPALPSVRAGWEGFGDRGAELRRRWQEMVDSYHREHPIGSGTLRRWTAHARSEPPTI